MRRLVPILILIAVAAASACGGSAPAATSATTTTTVDGEKAMLDFARCMRENGVDMPDPDTEGGGRFGMRAGAAVPKPEKFEEAHKACQKYMPKGGPMASLDPDDREKLQDAMLAFARCMRGRGIDMPDPQFTAEGGGMIIKRDAGKGGAGMKPLDEDDPAFSAAERECRKTTLEPMEKDLGIERPQRSLERRAG